MRYLVILIGAVDLLRIAPPSIAVGSTRGANFQQQFSTMGGAGTVTWSVTAGSLPPGWSLSSVGLLGGVATMDGNYTFTIQALDGANPPQPATAQYTVLIAEPWKITSSATLPDACVNQQYAFTPTTPGDVRPFFFNFLTNNWPLPFFGTSNGTFSGIPTTTGTYTAHFFGSDSSSPQNGVSQDITLNVKTCP